MLTAFPALANDRKVDLTRQSIPDGYSSGYEYAEKTSCSKADYPDYEQQKKCIQKVENGLKGLSAPGEWEIGYARFGNFGRVDIEAWILPKAKKGTSGGDFHLLVSCTDGVPIVKINSYSLWFDMPEGLKITEPDSFKLAVDGGEIISGQYAADFVKVKAGEFSYAVIFDGENAKEFLLSNEAALELIVELNYKNVFASATYAVDGLDRINGIVGTACQWW